MKKLRVKDKKLIKKELEPMLETLMDRVEEGKGVLAHIELDNDKQFQLHAHLVRKPKE